jgi:hypothetical protein
MPAAVTAWHHVTQVRVNEDGARKELAKKKPNLGELAWRLHRAEHHALHAFVAMLEALS